LSGILEVAEFGAREHAVTLVCLGDHLVDQVLAQRLFLFYPPHTLSLSAHEDLRQDLERAEGSVDTAALRLYRFRYRWGKVFRLFLSERRLYLLTCLIP